MSAFPSTKKPSVSRFWLEFNTFIATSPLNRKEERIVFPGARWRGRFQYPLLTREQFDEIEAFIVDLRGSYGTFQVHDFTKETPRGTALGTGKISGGFQTGSSILTSNWTASQSALFMPGDHIGVQGCLHIVTQQAASDGSGISTINISPALRLYPNGGETIIKSSVPFTARLIDDIQNAYQVSALDANMYQVAVEFVEAV